MEEKEDIFKYGLKGGEHEPVKEVHVDKAIYKTVKIIKKYFKLFLLLIIIGAIFYGGYSLKRCPVCEVCEVCEECIECPELDCSKCPKEIEKVTAIRYACSNGFIVDDLDECNPFNYIEITSDYKETKNGVTFSIDKLEYETVGTYHKIIEIDYTIVNMGEHEIAPIVLVNLYSITDEASQRGLVHEIFEDEEYVDSNAWLIKKQKTNIGFTGSDIVVRLVLRDKLPDPDKELVRVSRTLTI